MKRHFSNHLHDFFFYYFCVLGPTIDLSRGYDDFGNFFIIFREAAHRNAPSPSRCFPVYRYSRLFSSIPLFRAVFRYTDIPGCFPVYRYSGLFSGIPVFRAVFQYTVIPGCFPVYRGLFNGNPRKFKRYAGIQYSSKNNFATIVNGLSVFQKNVRLSNNYLLFS